jgi:hypothetical protein
MHESNNPMFKSLDDAEEAQFREYAENNSPPDLAQWNVYHPVCRQVWVARGETPLDFIPCSNCTVNHATYFQFCQSCAKQGQQAQPAE